MVFILCVYKIVFILIVIYVLLLWGVGFGGGYVFGFGLLGDIVVVLCGVVGFWVVNGLSLLVVGVLLVSYFNCVSCVVN